ncbi:alpha-xenorhabdolysin family binary toxin subunit A [Flavobacterium fluviatile]|uniref:alpha-xenorhabdolysin family binary toxin subunit A n=1 Tax=Flavobacterium fluviatile TaxID=1862387 RepID=UPI0013D68B25|nr:alpha-xenorhabdolysin family binary toxin subunit A [Flavobacterium fluviatile]
MIFSNETETLEIGPGVIAQASVAEGPAFILSATEWLAIQTYVENALALPTTTEAFKTYLGEGAPADMAPFASLITAYGNINKHVTTWQKDTFPASVSLASDIVNYAKQAPTYYNPILPLAEKLKKDPNDKDSKDALKGILEVLSKSASGHHTKAKTVAQKIQNFADDTQADKVVLTGVDGNGGLKKSYNEKYGATSKEVKEIKEDLELQQKILDKANKDYDHYVVVASTTPTYVWVWPFGTVAAAVVAGVYGDKAVKALEKVRATEQKIKNLNTKLATDALLIISVGNASSGISTTSDQIAAALPVIQKIQGVWGSIADDLNNIIETIDTNIAEALPIIMNLGVQTAINEWTEVGKLAEAYRLNAYITVKK